MCLHVQNELIWGARNALIFIHFLKQRTRAFTKLLVERGDGLIWGAGNALSFILFLKPRPRAFTMVLVERHQLAFKWTITSVHKHIRWKSECAITKVIFEITSIITTHGNSWSSRAYVGFRRRGSRPTPARELRSSRAWVGSRPRRSSSAWVGIGILRPSLF